jgi:bacteriocin biosynthesis cyclodehydratase domain-containing protein
LKRPLLPSHNAVWFEPPGEDGDEVLHVVSERRTLRLKGYAFREFCERVVPLLDGSRSLEEIHASTADVFEPEDLDRCLALLRDQGVVVDAAAANGVGSDAGERMTPQLNLFRDLAPGEDLQSRLASAHVALVGMGGAGPSAALALAAAGVGTISCHDPLPVVASDVYYAPFLGTQAVGGSRAESVARLVAAAAPEVQVRTSTRQLAGEDDLRTAIDGADFVVCCLDAGQTNLILKLNRVCLAENVRWIACALAGAEVVVGPAVHPGESACYLCYRMRAVAGAANPEEAFAYERYLDRRKRDDGAIRENLVFGAGVAGNLVGAEVAKELTGLGEPALVGRILVVRLTDLDVSRHRVLRKPGCPACFPTTHAGV